MHSFKDKEDRDWHLDITIGDVNRTLKLLGDIDLLQLGEGSPPLILRLSADHRLQCNVLYCLCKPQADEAGITDEQFGLLMGGGALRRGREALMAALVSFYQDLDRTEMVSVINQAEVLVKAAIAEAETQMDDVDMESAGRSIVASRFIETPESSELTPALSASGNSD